MKEDLKQIKTVVNDSIQENNASLWSKIQENNTNLLSQVQEMIHKSLLDFWEDLLEPNAALKVDVEEVKKDLGAVKQDVGVLKQDVGVLRQDVGVLKQDVEDIRLTVDSIDRKLTAEVGYRDRLEVRVKKVEEKIGIS